MSCAQSTDLRPIMQERLERLLDKSWFDLHKNEQLTDYIGYDGLNGFDY